MSKGNVSHTPQSFPQFSPQELNLIRLSVTHRYKIEQALTKFDYKDSKRYTENVKQLSQAISNILEIDKNLKTKFIGSFTDYISYEENVPIQVNFKKLRYEQFCHLVDQWEASIKEPSILRPSQRLYSIEHRNILFSRVFVQQKQVIEDYFEQLSEKKMLKGVDLYQLLGDILSHYFLYEFHTDNETFFEKINSFNNFLEVVNKFINSETRIIIDNKSKDFEYIKLYEFEALIYFWQSINPELEIRSDKRFSICSKEVQTDSQEILLSIEKGVQTVDSKEKVLSLEEIINGGLKSLNKLTEVENDPEKLEIIQNICESLRKEKIKLVQYEKQRTKNTRRRSDSRHVLQINSIDSRFLDVTSEQSDLQLQKTERILKEYSSPDELRESASKRKSDTRLSLDKTVEVSNQGVIKMKGPEVENKKKSPEKLKQVQFHSFSSENLNELCASSSSQTRPIKILPHSEFQELPLIKVPTFSARTQTLKTQTQEQQKRVHTGNQKVEERDSQKRSILGLLELIYNHYADKSSQSMSMKQLHQFFLDIGIVSERESLCDLRPLRLNPIRNLQSIKQIQFLEIMGLIMKDDEDLTYEVISEFVDVYVKQAEEKRVKTEIYQYEKARNVGNRDSFIRENKKTTYQIPLVKDSKDIYQNPYLRDQESHQISLKRDKEKHALREDKSVEKIGLKYPERSTKKLDPYSKTQNSLEREKSKDASSRKRRYMYCQETPKSQNEDYFNKFSNFGNNFYR